jgi:hypothetical protein
MLLASSILLRLELFEEEKEDDKVGARKTLPRGGGKLKRFEDIANYIRKFRNCAKEKSFLFVVMDSKLTLWLWSV